MLRALAEGTRTPPTVAERLPSFQLHGFVFKVAETSQEHDQVHRLNHRTFVTEVGQYEDDGSTRLVDKFDDKNVYFICKRGGRTIGMLAVHDQPPFSVAARLEDPRLLERLCPRPLEVRLFALKPEYRRTFALAGLLYTVYSFARRGGYSHLVISGISTRLPLYEKMGFRALGPARASGQAAFVPMVLAIEEAPVDRLRFLERIGRELDHDPAVCTPTVRLLPGPPTIAPEVREAYRRGALYHRGRTFVALFERVRERLGELAGGDMQVALLNGSGTLANDAVATCLAADPCTARGLVLANGEFGGRLARQAKRAGLRFDTLTWAWGKTWDLQEVERALALHPEVGWIWAVHQESSTGILNDGDGLITVARRHGCRVYLDAVSSFGAVPIPEGATVATGVSGKSLGAYPGISFVCARGEAFAGVLADNIPSYLELPRFFATRGPAFTFSSAPVRALHEALEPYRDVAARTNRYRAYSRLGRVVRQGLRSAGIEPLAHDAIAAPVITTFRPPAEMSSDELLQRCRTWGFHLGGDSSYLRQRNYVQIGTMGDVNESDLHRLFGRLRGLGDP